MTQRRQRQRGRDRADPQRALEAAAQPAGLLLQALEVGQRPLRPAEDPLALGRQPLELAAAPHERDAELALQAADARRQRRLRDVAGRRGAAEVALAVERREVLELADEHRLDHRCASIEPSLAALGQLGRIDGHDWCSCRAISSSWSAAITSRERRPRSTCSRRRWISAVRSPTTIAASPRSARACPRPRSTASRRSTTTCSRRAARRHVRVCTGTACFAATGDAHVDEVARRARPRARRAPRGRLGLAGRDGLPRLLPREPGGARRRRDRRRARASSSGCSRGATRPAPEPVVREPARRAGADPPGRLVRARGARSSADRRRRCSTRSRPPTCAAAAAPASPPARSGSSPAARRASASSIVANGDEGDPGSYIDKFLMEDNPDAAARGHGARRLRGRRRPRLRARALGVPALQAGARGRGAARARRLLRRGHARRGFSFDVTIVEGAGSYVVGEETALLSCLQGLRGTVSARPPFPAERGVHGMPTVVNNVETLCNIPFVARDGADAYRALSPDGATPGSKLVCFNERFARPGVYEVPFGMTVRELCEDVAGGLRDGRTIKALQIGGPLGGILPALAARHACSTSTPLAAEGCMVGHGGIVAFDDRTDMRDVAQAPAALRRRRELRQVLPVPHRAAPRARDVRRPTRRSSASGSRSCSRRSSSAACARTAAACRRRSAACSRTSPRSWGSRDHARRSTARTVEVERRDDRARRRRARPAARSRRCASTTARRRSARAASAWSASRARRGRSPRARRSSATGMKVDTTRRRPRAASPTAVVELVLSELPRAAAPSTPSWPPSARHARRRRAALAGRAATPVAHDERASLPRAPARAVHLAAGAACARATRSRARSR